jgi:hypothetical protein
MSKKKELTITEIAALPYLTKEQAKVLLQIETTALNRYIRSGRLVVSKIGGESRTSATRIMRSDLDEFVRKSRVLEEKDYSQYNTGEEDVTPVTEVTEKTKETQEPNKPYKF